MDAYREEALSILEEKQQKGYYLQLLDRAGYRSYE